VRERWYVIVVLKAFRKQRTEAMQISLIEKQSKGMRLSRAAFGEASGTAASNSNQAPYAGLPGFIPVVD
jgi:hypothetical protein